MSVQQWVQTAVVVVLGSVLSAGAAAETWVSVPAFELASYRFVAEADDAAAVFINPAGLAGAHGTNLYLDLTGDDSDITESVTSLQGGSWGFAYRHRDLNPDRAGGLELSSLGLPAAKGSLDTYMLSSSFGSPAFRLGVSRVWHNTDLSGEDSRGWSVGWQSRPHRQVSLGATVENADKDEFAGGRLRPRYAYGLALRPLSGRPELLTVNAQGSHRDGSADLIDLSYGVNVRLESGATFGAVLTDPAGGDLEIGAFVSTHFGKGATTLRARTISGPEEYRGNASLQIYDEFWQESFAASRDVVTLELNGHYEDEASGFVLMGSETHGVRDVVRRLKDAGGDPDVRALAVRVHGLSSGFVGPVSAALEELRQGLVAFRDTGHPVVVYLDGIAGGSELYLASAADRVVMPPLTGVQGVGVNLQVSRYRAMFEKLGVEWDADTSGVYKSSFHGFYTDSATTRQAAAIQSLVDTAFDHLTKTLAEARQLSPAAIASIATGRVVFPEECVELGLVDALGWWDDALKEADKLSGGSGEALPRTKVLPRREYWEERWKPAPAVAVVPAYGSIRSGKSGRDWVQGGRTMGSRTVVRQLRAAAAHPNVRAVVFRVDSGGGSALASEEIRQEILRLKKKEIPFVVSMGAAAASGGYWISMDGDAVFANPSTVTGSIGVVWAAPVLEKLFAKTGISVESYKRGEHTDMMAAHRHFTEEERAMIDASLEYIYDAFVDGVAEGRALPEARVRELAQGRVYMGTQALELGLVDRLGTLDDAVKEAATRSGIAEDYRVLTFRPGTRGVLQKVLSSVGVGDVLSIPKLALGLPRFESVAGVSVSDR